jgi:hypothetical protein
MMYALERDGPMTRTTGVHTVIIRNRKLEDNATVVQVVSNAVQNFAR